MCKSFDARNVATTFTYDSSGYLTAVATPSPLGDSEMTYDTFGRVKTVDDGKGQVRTFSYDPLDRLTNADYNGATAVAYTYDAYGNATNRLDGSTPWAMAYDDANRLLDIDGPAAPAGYPADMYDVAFAYDRVGNLTSLTDVGGTTGYTFTNLNMTETITDPDGGVTTYRYDDAQHGTWRTSIDYANDTTSTMTYDASGRVTRVVNREADGTVASDLGYEFKKGTQDAMLRSKVTTPARSTTYGYDKVNRLTSAVLTINGGGTASTHSYTYDGAGNRTKAVVNGATSSFSYNTADQLTTPGVAHDANGNMTAGGAHGYTNQVFNQLDQATSITPKNQAARTQDYAGQLQSKWLRDGQTRFTNAASVGMTAVITPTQTSTFVRDPSGTLVSMKRGSSRSHYFYDGRGSIDSLTDATGNTVQRYLYDPYGRDAGSIGTIDQPFRWNGEYALNDYDYKIGARYYDASIARWTQQDPSGQEPNAYAYAANDPINNSDPTGLECYGGGNGGTETVCTGGATEYAASQSSNNGSWSCFLSGSGLAFTVAAIIWAPPTGGVSIALAAGGTAVGAASVASSC